MDTQDSSLKFCKDCAYGNGEETNLTTPCQHPLAQDINLCSGQITSMWCSTMRSMSRCGQEAVLFKQREN